MANEFIARKGLIALNNSGISGSLDVSGSLTIESSGSTLFEVIGSEGQLFSITDSLSGSLFAVSDISGLPVLEAFSDNTVKIGTFNNEGLIVGGTNVTASNLLASDVTISHTPSSSPTSLVIGNPPHLVHTIEIASGSTNVMRFASNTGNGGQHTIGFSGHTRTNSMQAAIIGKAQGASGRVDLYFALASGDNVTATTSDAKIKITTSETTIYNNVHAQADTFEIGGSNTGDSILYLGDEKRTGIARDYRGAGNASDFVVMTMGSLGGTSVPTTHTRLRVTKEGDTEISGSLTASQNVDIQGTLSLPGFSDVSASLAASSIPAGTISSSAQVDHDSTTNFSADEHFTQANITTVGTVTSGDISAILPSGVLSGSAQIATDISGSFTSTSASIATDISNIERLSKGRITYLYTSSNDASPTVASGYIHYSDSAQDRIILSTSSYNGVDLDASVNNDYSHFQYGEEGSLLTIRKVSDGSFKTYKVTTVTTDIFGFQGQVGYLVDGASFAIGIESGSISNGDEVEFIWDKSAGVGGAYGPTEGNLTKTFAGLYQPGYNYLDMFFGKATDTEFDGSPENLSGVESSASFATPTSYFLPAISQSESLTLGGLTVNGTITGTTITGTTTLFDTGSSTLSSDGGSLGDIVKFGGSSTTAGGLYYLNSSGGWTLAQANAGGTSTGSLAVALGTNSTTDGMLLRGFVNPFGLSDAGIGAPVYVASASAGRFSGLPSQQTGEIVRVVGHAYGSDLVYFNPSNNWIEL